MKTYILAAVIFVLSAATLFYFARQNFGSAPPVQVINSQSPGQSTIAPRDAGPTIVAENLDVPWSMAFLPDQTLITTQRDGVLTILADDPVEIQVSGAEEIGEGGLMGIALHPNYDSNRFIYLYFTTRNNAVITNKVAKYAFENNTLTQEKTIIENIPGNRIHNGGYIAFGPDGLLYITTGDAGNESLAQNTSSLAGKILRLHDDGTIPRDNPFGNAVYSYGHRNPQGLAWDAAGRLWSIEHGRSGAQSGYDEINLIEKGVNYGWPLIQGDDSREGMRSPVLHSGAGTTWAPGAIAYNNSKLYFTGLRGQAIFEVSILSDTTLGNFRIHVKDTYGRLRGIVVGPQNTLLLSTSNRDGRGTVRSGDDKIIRIAIP